LHPQRDLVEKDQTSEWINSKIKEETWVKVGKEAVYLCQIGKVHKNAFYSLVLQ
jgi:hypothetical protein